jgi:chlorite dismutase
MDQEASNRPEIRERGMGADGKPVFSDRRLYVQFLAYTRCRDARPLAALLAARGVRGAVYADINDPMGIGLVAAHEQADYFVEDWRTVLQSPELAGLEPRPEYTLLGRSYAIGYETDLERALITRPLERITNPAWPWAIWYPLRRRGAFEQLPPKEQREILMEHGAIGNAFGEADYARDIRLACFGLDKNDNDFVIGVVGKELYPLSAIVQAMRKTRQTSQLIERLGPFFIGKAVWQSPSA